MKLGEGRLFGLGLYLAWITWSKREECVMDELVALVVTKTGASEDVARTATETVLTFVKDRLPAGLGETIDGLLQGGEGSPLSGLGGLGKLD